MTKRYFFVQYGLLSLVALGLLLCTTPALHAQDANISVGVTGAGVTKLRLAVADFKPASADPQSVPLKKLFDTTLENDLKNAGIFDVVSKSMQPQSQPGAPQEINLGQWSAAPASAAMVVFGSFNINSGRVIIGGYLFDAKNTAYPNVLARQYNEEQSDAAVREIAHRFADEIILRLGGGIPGIAETKIYFARIAGDPKSPTKEIWVMDYDGADAHAVHPLGTDSITPRVSPDNQRLAFSSLDHSGWRIRVYSLLLGRMVNFLSNDGSSRSPAWSPDGNQIAFSSSRTGDPEIYISDASGNNVRRVTSFRGPDTSPVWNPKTGGQIAWVSGRTGLPAIWMMDSDGSNSRQLTQGGYATSPSWSPDGKFLAFAWDRRYGPGAPGGQDIYVINIASGQWIQLTHDTGPCDFPSWAPDGRHIVYANGKTGHTRIMTMLADGTQKQALTPVGNDMPNWSWK